VKIRTKRAEDTESLRELGDENGDISSGAVFVAARAFADWQSAENELTDAFHLAQEASEAGAPMVFIVDSDAMLGRGKPLDSMVATGLISGARTLAFEGIRKNRYVGIIATDRSPQADHLAEAVRFSVANRAGHGQVLVLGTGHVGAMFP
jgi:hypothetical protein